MAKQITVEDKIKEYRADTLLWVRDIFGENIREAGQRSGTVITTKTGLTKQQESACKEFDKLVQAKLKLADKKKLTEKELEYSKKIGISISSGHLTGKDFFVSLLIWKFLHVFPFPKIVCTANTAKQLKNVLWSELYKTMKLSVKINDNVPETLLENLFEHQSEKIFAKPYQGKQWFAEAVTISTQDNEEKQAEALAGRNEDYKLYVIDEAAGVADPVFKPFESALSGKLNIVVMIFNPTRTRGYAINSQGKDRDRWITLRWNAEESERVSKDNLKVMENKYGRDSNTYRVRVLGKPPLSDSDSLIPYDWIDEAIEKDLKPLDDDAIIGGLDCGGGGDKSVICVRQGNKVLAFKRNNDKDPMAVCGWSIQVIDEFGIDALFVDSGGIGHGIYGRIKEVRRKGIYGINNSRNADNEDKFFNKRAECYWRLRERFLMLSIPNDKELIEQLGAIKTDNKSSDGRIKIIKKEVIKKGIGHSPDESDALALTFAKNESIFRRVDKDEDDRFDRLWEKQHYHEKHSHSWMGV